MCSVQEETHASYFCLVKQEIVTDSGLACTAQTQFKNATVRDGTTDLAGAEFQSITLMCTFTTWLEPYNIILPFVNQH